MFFTHVVSAQLTPWESEPPYLAWYYRDIGNFRILYEPQSEQYLMEMERVIYKHFATLVKLFDNLQSSEHRIHVVIDSRAQYPNGFFTALPPTIILHTSSLGISGKGTSWLEFVFLHELAHYLHLHYSRGLGAKVSKLLGPALKSLSTIFTPPWLIEGVAVNIESDFTDFGRLNDPFFILPTRADVLLGTLPEFSVARLSRGFEFEFGRIYQYGSFLFQHIQEEYGFDAFIKIWQNYVQSPLFFETELKNYLGKDLNRIHEEMEEKLYQRFYAESGDFPRGRRLLPGSSSQTKFSLIANTDEGMVAYRNGADVRSGFVTLSQDMQDTVALHDVRAFSPFFSTGTADITPDAGSIVYVGSTFNTNASSLINPLGYSNFKSVYNDLYIYDVSSRSIQRLTKMQQLYMPSISSDGSFVISSQRRGIYSRLIKIDRQTHEQGFELLYEPTYGEILEKSISPDKRMVAFIEKNVTEGISLQTIDLLSGERRVLIASDTLHFYDLRFIDNTTLQFISDIEMPNRLLQLYAVSLENMQLTREAQDMVGIGSARHLEDGSLVYLSNDGKGFALYHYSKDELESTPIAMDNIAELRIIDEVRAEPTQELRPRGQDSTEMLRTREFSTLPSRFAYWHPTVYGNYLGANFNFIPGVLIQFFGATLLSSLKIELAHYFDTTQTAVEFQPLYTFTYSFAWRPIGDFVVKTLRNISYFSTEELYRVNYIHSVHYGRILLDDLRENMLSMVLSSSIYNIIGVNKGLGFLDSFNFNNAITYNEYGISLLYLGETQWYSRENPLAWKLNGEFYYRPPLFSARNHTFLGVLNASFRLPVASRMYLIFGNRSSVSNVSYFSYRHIMHRINRLLNDVTIYGSGQSLALPFDSRFTTSPYKFLWSLDLHIPLLQTASLGNSFIQPYEFYMNLFTEHSFAVQSNADFIMSDYFDVGAEFGTEMNINLLTVAVTAGVLFRVPYRFDDFEYRIYILFNGGSKHVLASPHHGGKEHGHGVDLW